MGISLKRITDMVVAQTLQGDEHLFLQIGNAFQEVPLPVLAAAITRTIGFPKSADDLSAEFAAALEENADLTAQEFLFSLPAGSYILSVPQDGGGVITYQCTTLAGKRGNVSRWLFTSGESTTAALYSTAYDETDPLILIDGDSGELSLQGEAIATRTDITNAMRGLGVPIVKESAASAELAQNTYAASGDNFPTVVPADQTPDHRPVGKGSQIVFIPEHNNTGTDPTLTLNNGVSVPIRQRAAIDTQTADNTVQIAANTLIQGMPYTLTFCGVAWLIDSYLPGEGSETTARVTSVNNQTGRVTITADGIGAALASYNWQPAKRGYDIYNENVEHITPKDYCFEVLPQGLYYLRADDGQHFFIRSDMGTLIAAENESPAHRSGPPVRLYLHIPVEQDGTSVISGGAWIDDLKIIEIKSLADLSSLTFLINDSKVVTEQALLTRLSGYVTNAALLLTLQRYAPISEPDFLGNIEVRPETRSATTTRIEPNKVKMFSGAASVTLSSSSHNENNFLNVSGTDETEDVIVRGVSTPLSDNDAANKEYVDDLFSGATDGKVFMSVYGTTPYADIAAALAAGKLIYVRHNGKTLFCTRTVQTGSGYIAEFSFKFGNVTSFATVESQANTWASYDRVYDVYEDVSAEYEAYYEETHHDVEAFFKQIDPETGDSVFPNGNYKVKQSEDLQVYYARINSHGSVFLEIDSYDNAEGFKFHDEYVNKYNGGVDRTWEWVLCISSVDYPRITLNENHGKYTSVENVADPVYDHDAANKEYVDTSISNIWKDITAEWNTYREEHDEVDFVIAARSFTKTLEDGHYTFSGDGAVVHTHLITAGSGVNAAQYRFIWFVLPDGNVPTFEYYKGDTRILGTSSPDGVLRLTVLGNTVVYKDEFRSALAGLPSRESVSAEMAQKVNEVTQTYNALSVIRTRLQKFKGTPHTIRVEIENAHMLYDEENVILQLWICSRKHGSAHHWWHPSQPGSPTKTSPIGYAMIAGNAIYPNRPLENAYFPAVPAWMPNNGYVLTEIPVTHEDLVNGYVDIDCATYFLPMMKPKSTQWRYKDVYMMFTQRGEDANKRYSVPVTWTVGVLRDGKYCTVGSYANIAKIGIPRGFNGTIVDGTTKKKTIKAMHISIK